MTSSFPSGPPIGTATRVPFTTTASAVTMTPRASSRLTPSPRKWRSRPRSQAQERLRHRRGLRQIPHDGQLLGGAAGPSQSTSDINKRDFAGYADEKIFPFQDLALEAGYRRQKSSFDVDYRDFVNPAVSDTGTSNYVRDAYRLSANYAILKKANIFASYSEGFRFPTTESSSSTGTLRRPAYTSPPRSTPRSSPRPPGNSTSASARTRGTGLRAASPISGAGTKMRSTSTPLIRPTRITTKRTGRASNRASSSTSPKALSST